jgi:cytochrome c oxidase cbb3-type subunit 4
MIYEDLRQFADSWGLVLMGVAFVTFIGWSFLPHARAANRRAAMMILENEDETNG